MYTWYGLAPGVFPERCRLRAPDTDEILARPNSHTHTMPQQTILGGPVTLAASRLAPGMPACVFCRLGPRPPLQSLK